MGWFKKPDPPKPTTGPWHAFDTNPEDRVPGFARGMGVYQGVDTLWHRSCLKCGAVVVGLSTGDVNDAAEWHAAWHEREGV